MGLGLNLLPASDPCRDLSECFSPWPQALICKVDLSLASVLEEQGTEWLKKHLIYKPRGEMSAQPHFSPEHGNGTPAL